MVKKMKLSDLRKKSKEELEIEVKELKSELFKLRFQHATNQLENPLKIKEVKRNIARVKTLIKEKELGIR
jgi:large subunit ribosomal protein L29